MIETKACSICGETKPIDDFHRQPSGKLGRHSYCADCANEKRTAVRPTTSDGRGYTKPQKKRWLLKQRYGLTPEDFEELFSRQGGKCAICDNVPARPCVDHNHDTGAVRGILCHGCNIKLPAVEDGVYREKAIHYLAANDNKIHKEAA